MAEETNLDYRDGSGTHHMKGTVIPSARRDAAADDSGVRFDPHTPVPFNLVDTSRGDMGRSVSVTPDEMVGANQKDLDAMLTKGGNAPMRASAVALNKAMPKAAVGIVDDEHLGFEQPITPIVVPVKPSPPKPDLAKIAAEESNLQVPDLAVNEPKKEDVQASAPPILLPALGDRGAPVTELYENDGEVPLSKIPTQVSEVVSGFQKVDAPSLPKAGTALMQASREKIRFVGSFGKLSVPYNMVWRHGFTLAMIQFSEDGIFYEPQDAVGDLEVWWRGNLFICMPNVIYLPFPDGKVSLSIFFVNEEETARKRELLKSKEDRGT